LADRDQDSAEDRLIARFFKPLATHPGALGLTDDAAVLAAPEGADLVLKTDAIIGGVHFFEDDPPAEIARKALRVNLSDLAAKGARPLGFLVSLAIPAGIGSDWLQAFSEGLKADSEEFSVPLMGGDTDRTPGPATIAVFVLGAVPLGRMPRRAGAKPGDRVLVSGTIGDGALGLKLFREPALAKTWNLTREEADHLRARYRLPRPRLALADAVRTHASASMDVSDGLAGDLAKLCRVSGVSATIDAGSVPLSAGARRAHDADPAQIETILTGGDDYEVLCTVPPDRLASFKAAAEKAGVAVTELGSVMAGTDTPVFHGRDGKRLVFAKASFSHF
jgi:thiamine-monophosphate kinase